MYPVKLNVFTTNRAIRICIVYNWKIIFHSLKGNSIFFNIQYYDQHLQVFSEWFKNEIYYDEQKCSVNKSCCEDVEGFFYHDTKYQMPYSITFYWPLQKKFVLIADIEFLDKHLKAEKVMNGLQYEYITYKICEYASQNVYL